MDSAVTGALGGKTMQAAGENIGEGPTAPHPFAKAQVLSAAEETAVIEDSDQARGYGRRVDGRLKDE